MPYATPNDVLFRYPLKRIAEVTQHEGQEVETKRVKVALEDASAEIDSYLGKVYSLPLATPPPVLKRLAIDIAVYRLMSLLPKEMVEDARQRYEDAIKWLQELAEGQIQLDGVAETSGGSGRVAYVSSNRVFDSETGLKGFL
jgi:phage gp36-like protein